MSKIFLTDADRVLVIEATLWYLDNCLRGPNKDLVKDLYLDHLTKDKELDVLDRMDNILIDAKAEELRESLIKKTTALLMDLRDNELIERIEQDRPEAEPIDIVRSALIEYAFILDEEPETKWENIMSILNRIKEKDDDLDWLIEDKE